MARKFLLILLISFGFLNFLALPVPKDVDGFVCGLILLSFIMVFWGVICGLLQGISKPNSALIFVLSFYLVYLLMSATMGLVNGKPIFQVMRSIGPYIIFFPLIFLGFLSPTMLQPRDIAIALLLVGACQVGYHFYLYFSNTFNASSAATVLLNRITLKDVRTTLPMLLATAILPVQYIYLNKKEYKETIMAFTLICLSLFAAIMTLTRAMVLSILVGWIVYFYLYIKYRYCLYGNDKSLRVDLMKIIIFVIMVTGLLLLLRELPMVSSLEDALLGRILHQDISGVISDVDYSNGRCSEEWLPALNTWLKSGIVENLLGTGAGVPFYTASGSERTYIHNLLIYVLLYGGVLGLLIVLAFYFVLFKSLVSCAIKYSDPLYLGFASLLAALFFYAQFFAVHKLLAFNAMLFLITVVALLRKREPQSLQEMLEIGKV